MILLKRRQKVLQRRELAESIEDAKIFASSRQLDPTQNIMMQPLDQVKQCLSVFMKFQKIVKKAIFKLFHGFQKSTSLNHECNSTSNF